MSEFAKESLSLEETNKLRIQLGLKPLVDDGPSKSAGGDQKPSSDDGAVPQTSQDQDAIAAENYARAKEERRKAREQDEVRERIAKAQNKRELARKLQGPTLGDPEPSSSSASTSKDTLKWLKQSAKRAKEHAARRAKELEEQEAQALAEYGESDLAGLRVAHDLDDFEEGEERILTLKDSRILDGEDDELMDLGLEQKERDKINLERKKGIREYTGLDDEEFGIETVGRKRGVLSKYDADIDDNGFKKDEDSGFVLGAGTKPSRSEAARQEMEAQAAASNRKLLSLDYAKNLEVSDYLQEGDVGFKKPKTKKKKRSARVKLDFEDDGPAASSSSAARGQHVAMEDASTGADSTQLEVKVRAPRTIETENFVDDDELQASLAKARRQKAKRTFTKMTPEMIAKNLAAQKEAEEAERKREGSRALGDRSTNGEDGEGSGLTFDDTTEFVRNINHKPSAEEKRRTVKKEESTEPAYRLTGLPTSEAAAKREAEANGIRIKEEASDDGFESATFDAAELGVTVKKEEGEESDEEMGAISEQESRHDVKRESEEVMPVSASEPLVSKGLASTLSLLKNQGMLQPITPEQLERERQQKQYDKWLAERRKEDQLREAERLASKAQGSSKDQATREYENRMREIEDARAAQEKFKNYNPDIEIKYHDEFGRTLTPHEAWKNLSHVFHGKGPGFKKQEKRRKMIEDERKRERMSAGDTPSGMNKAFQERSERTGQAHMVLSVGNRGNAPQDLEFLGPNTLQKEKKGKEKEKEKDNKGRTTSGSPFRGGIEFGGREVLLGSNSVVVRNGGFSSVTSSVGGGSRSGTASVSAAGMRPTFAPVKSGLGTEQHRVGDEDGKGDSAGKAKFKLAFGANASSGNGVKRKAEAED
ncbi:hypothetical protein IE53DRAFT_385065 [Violaceomyces palustris]|uniref:Uncharacterized protein n=1 Tax=Violaceomyces palustris TaxID=1673888 RepID=A0ACD0P364_9BASI|nr:hypothetical protein IE53DRAFT_385065 [Violaceomyces palustris]